MSHYFKKQFANNSNCLMLTEFNCAGCHLHLLSDSRSGDMYCPGCGTLLDAGGSIILNHGVCNHSLDKDRHQHHI